MVSSAQETLRGSPEKCATIYNEYAPWFTKLRLDLYTAGPAKQAQNERRVTAAQNALQGLFDQANQAEATIRQRVEKLNAGGPASQVDAVSRDNILLMLQQKRGIDDIARVFIGQQDRASFGVLKAMLPILIGDEKERQHYADTIALLEQQMYTRDELMLLAEVYECDASMGMLRDNFNRLFKYFSDQLLPGAFAGMGNRLESLWPWYGASPERIKQLHAQGVEWEQLPTAKLLLNPDIPQRFSYGYDAQTGGEGRSPSPYQTNHDSYMAGVRGAPGTGWQDTPVRPLRGSLP